VLLRRQYECVARGVAASMLGRHAGLNQRDIGALLGMGSGSAVCRQLQRLRDPKLRRKIESLTQALQTAAQQG